MPAPLEVKRNRYLTINSIKFLQEVSKYLRNQYKITPCGVILQVSFAHLQAGERTRSYL